MKINLKKHAPLILSVLASIGVVATAVTSAKAYEKAAKEPEDEKWKHYIPPVLIGSGTIACIIGSQYLNRKQQEALTSAYIFLYDTFAQYRNKVIEKHGIDAHREILDEIMAEKAEDMTFHSNSLLTDGCGYYDKDEPDVLFYDEFSKRYFEAKPTTVLQAEYHLNRNYCLGAELTINDWYDFLGIDHIDGGDIEYLDIESGLGWIDFDHHRVKLEDDLECWCIDIITAFGGPPDG